MNLVFVEDKVQLILQFEIQPNKRSQLRFYMKNRVVCDPTHAKSNTPMGQTVFPHSAAVPENCHKPTYPIKFELNGGEVNLPDVVLPYQLHLDTLDSRLKCDD